MSHRTLTLSATALAVGLSAGCGWHRPYFFGCCPPPACGPVCAPGVPGPVVAAAPPSLPFGFGGPTGVPVGAGPVGDPGCATCGSSPLASLPKGGEPAFAVTPTSYPGPGMFGAPGGGFPPPGAPIATTPPPAGSVFTGPPTPIVPPPMIQRDPPVGK